MSPSKTKTEKYRKPRPDFPLFPHATGRWAKKIRGKTEYFGRIEDDPKGERALQELVDQIDRIQAGRERRVIRDALTVKELVNRFLTWKVMQCEAGALKFLSLFRWRKVCAMVIDEFGAMQAVEDLGPDDFSRLMKSRLVNKAPSEQASFVIYIRALFTFAFNDEQRLIPEPVLFGLAFRPPKLARRHKGDNEEGRSFRADQIREIISYTDGAIRAMILLGINCGFGNNDCATLTFHNLDLDGGWHSHPRPKTGAERRCPLWAETVAAIRDSIKIRPKPADVSHSDLVFITKYGHPYVRPSDRALKSFAAGRLDHLEWTDGLRATMTYNLKLLGMKRKGLSFYSLRHTFESVGGGAKDQIAVDAIMGHITRGEGTTYRDFIDDKRLRDVTDYVHAWLFPADNSSEKKGP